MIIEKIEKVKGRKNIFKVFSDKGGNMLLCADSIVKFAIKAGMSLSVKELEDILSFDMAGRVVSDALALAAKRSYSRENLYKKLILKGYDAENANAAVERLKELNYINDEKYAREYALYLISRGKGEYALRAGLEKAGISKDLIKNVLESVKSAGEPYEQIIKIMRKKFGDFDPENKNEIRKIAAFFLRRGFPLQEIGKAFRKYKNAELEISF